MLKYLLASAALVGGATTAHAATFTFQSMLDAAQSTTGTTSTATGMASISVDDDDETIDFSLSVDGLSLDGLNDAFVDGANAALGPIHIHDGDAGLTGPVAIPFVFDTSAYMDTATGFQVNVVGLEYSAAVAISGFPESFEDFLSGLRSKEYYINIHSDANPGGEIRGQISAVPLPASSLMLLAALGGFAAMRRKAS